MTSIEYRVRSGDTLRAIARRHQVTEQQLLHLNGLSDVNHLRAGHVLRIPKHNAALANAPARPPRLHRVQANDTLASIAQRNNIPLDALMQANNISDPKKVCIGHCLTIPSGDSPSPKSEKFSSPVQSSLVTSLAAISTIHTLFKGEKAANLEKATRSGEIGLTTQPSSITVKFKTVMTSDSVAPAAKPVWNSDNDFSPRLKEQVKVTIDVSSESPPFSGTLCVDFVRLTFKATGAAKTEEKESVTLVARVEVPVKVDAKSVTKEVIWDGKSTVAVPRELSNRTTWSVNESQDVRIPMTPISKGDAIPHGIYFIHEITLTRDAETVAKDNPKDVYLSVPQLANLTFNEEWDADIAAFGLQPFKSSLEEALRRFGGRDYNTRASKLDEVINVRFITDKSIGRSQCMLASIGGLSGTPGLFGQTKLGPAIVGRLASNVYAMYDAIGSDVEEDPGGVWVYPGSFMEFNQPHPNRSESDTAAFHEVFSPLGVSKDASRVSRGTTAARTTSKGKVTGACTVSEDLNNIVLTMDDDGMVTVKTKNRSIVPDARAKDIQTAFRMLVRLIGNTINHEMGHAFGLVSSAMNPDNRFLIGKVMVSSPLSGTDNHNSDSRKDSTAIMDDGKDRDFRRRVEWKGEKQRQKFNEVNKQYLLDCIPRTIRKN
jgi:LysM repeat protein